MKWKWLVVKWLWVLLGIASIIGGLGTSVSQGVSPPDLPGGTTVSPPFVTTAGFLADSDPPPSGNGVGPGEMVAIIFDLMGVVCSRTSSRSSPTVDCARAST